MYQTTLRVSTTEVDFESVHYTGVVLYIRMLSSLHISYGAVQLHDSISEERYHYLVFDL